jgi:isopentenyl diphosphate isomerase/L-lactate dehydrogenase-like FMN-dependent dehydrogenase
MSSAYQDAGSPGDLWFQLYVMKRREATEVMIRQAEELGYSALVVTVDAPRLGKLVVHQFYAIQNVELKNDPPG